MEKVSRPVVQEQLDRLELRVLWTHGIGWHYGKEVISESGKVGDFITFLNNNHRVQKHLAEHGPLTVVFNDVSGVMFPVVFSVGMFGAHIQ